MVIANSTSNNTLVGLEEYHNKQVVERLSTTEAVANLTNHRHIIDLERTDILLPNVTISSQSFEDEIGNQEQQNSHEISQSSYNYSPLYIPRKGQHENSHLPVDEYLQCLLPVRQSCEDLLRVTPLRHFDGSCNSRLLYVGQGERASCDSQSLNNSTDILVSDRATTCHILAFRSTSSSTASSNRGPFTSLTHLDSTKYERCIRMMIDEHLDHYSQLVDGSKDKSESQSKITMDIHILGGFNDSNGTSLAITEWLIHLLKQIAAEYKYHSVKMDMVLKTCVVSSMNDDGFTCPIGRGMGIDVHSGEVFLAKCEPVVTGPVPVLRSVRLWSKPTSGMLNAPTLSVVQNSIRKGLFIVEPFAFEAFPDMSSLLSLPDDILLQYTSTSPDVEEEDFCDCIRSSLYFLNHFNCQELFGRDIDQPLVFTRSFHNQWKRVTQ